VIVAEHFHVGSTLHFVAVFQVQEFLLGDHLCAHLDCAGQVERQKAIGAVEGRAVEPSSEVSAAASTLVHSFEGTRSVASGT